MEKFELMVLPYAAEALEPVISKETIGFHHGKHLAGYVNNLNGLLEGSALAGLPLEEIVLKAEGGMLNNAGAECCQPHSEGSQAAADFRCLGTCLLSGLSEPPS